MLEDEDEEITSSQLVEACMVSIYIYIYIYREYIV